ncbi:ribbon-helix-helix domain-containing protein [Deinococcus sp.]|uniref:CopG family ribbon-helix-helix protein n=1 Tax=Deinococcus sp. TaxID=47478 RepID=UPI0025F38E8E|nr:ribbon-helix-helix domain-containing protein [Deinococcus sp.]
MKFSVSLPQSQLAFLDHYQQTHKLKSRSKALQHAIQQLQDRELEEAYRLAGEEWQESEDAALWAKVSGERLS